MVKRDRKSLSGMDECVCKCRRTVGPPGGRERSREVGRNEKVGNRYLSRLRKGLRKAFWTECLDRARRYCWFPEICGENGREKGAVSFETKRVEG
jgi:hypothetical protein